MASSLGLTSQMPYSSVISGPGLIVSPPSGHVQRMDPSPSWSAMCSGAGNSQRSTGQGDHSQEARTRWHSTGSPQTKPAPTSRRQTAHRFAATSNLLGQTLLPVGPIRLGQRLGQDLQASAKTPLVRAQRVSNPRTTDPEEAA
jgi:hypothetical protein